VIGSGYILIAFFLGAALALRADLRRRRLSVGRAAGWNLPSTLDVSCLAASTGVACSLAMALIPAAVAARAIPLDSALAWGLAAAVAIAVFIWHEGKRQVQFQRPAGIVFGEWLILCGAYQLAEGRVFQSRALWPPALPVTVLCLAAMVAGGAWIAIIVPPFVKRFEGLAIVERVAERGEFVQAEYVSPTAECPHPERWKMLDAQTAEIEVLDFLKSLVVTVKPSLIVETGTFLGHSAIKMAEGLKENGFGRLVTIEYDPTIFAQARERIEASGLRAWIDCRNASSLECGVEGRIDLLFSDSDPTIREEEIKRFLPQMSPGALVLVHDASSQFKVVREAAFRLEQEGLISVVLLPTPRGLVVAQKRQDRQ
jgi:predicted O-methyltransferase YrrM